MQNSYNAGFVQLVSFLSRRFNVTLNEADIATLYTNVQNVNTPNISDILGTRDVLQTPAIHKWIEPQSMRNVIRKILDHKKIEAIKEFRTATNSGLKEAKDAVEAMADEINAGITDHLAQINSLVKINPRFNQLQRDTLDTLIHTYRSDRVF